jgi:hypothetical protein
MPSSHPLDPSRQDGEQFCSDTAERASLLMRLQRGCLRDVPKPSEKTTDNFCVWQRVPPRCRPRPNLSSPKSVCAV